MCGKEFLLLITLCVSDSVLDICVRVLFVHGVLAVPWEAKRRRQRPNKVDGCERGLPFSP